MYTPDSISQNPWLIYGLFMVIYKRSRWQFKDFKDPFGLSPFPHQVATQHRVAPDDMPELLVVLSDMQLGGVYIYIYHIYTYYI